MGYILKSLGVLEIHFAYTVIRKMHTFYYNLSSGEVTEKIE
jgi:hypothetical protein